MCFSKMGETARNCPNLPGNLSIFCQRLFGKPVLAPMRFCRDCHFGGVFGPGLPPKKVPLTDFDRIFLASFILYCSAVHNKDWLCFRVAPPVMVRMGWCWGMGRAHCGSVGVVRGWRGWRGWRGAAGAGCGCDGDGEGPGRGGGRITRRWVPSYMLHRKIYEMRFRTTFEVLTALPSRAHHHRRRMRRWRGQRIRRGSRGMRYPSMAVGTAICGRPIYARSIPAR